MSLLGDAPHATTHNLGQGACQAIEDGFALATCLTNYPSIEQALRAYQSLRKSRTDRVVQLSRQIGRAADASPWLKPFLFGVMKQVPASFTNRQFNAIYDQSYWQAFK